MRWRSVGVPTLLLVLGVILLLGIGVVGAQTRTVTWSAVTQYVDNTPIGPEVTVSYSVWRQDNVTKVSYRLADHVAGTSVAFDDSSLIKGRTYNFTAQAHGLYVATGLTSDSEMSEVYPWTLPLVGPGRPLNLRVAP